MKVKKSLFDFVFGFLYGAQLARWVKDIETLQYWEYGIILLCTFAVILYLIHRFKNYLKPSHI